MFSIITNIYNMKTKGPTVMELFTTTGKLKKFFFLTTRDIRCVHHGWHGTHRYDIQVLATHASTWIFSTGFEIYSDIKLHENSPVGTELLHADGRTYGHDEANIRFWLFCKGTKICTTHTRCSVHAFSGSSCSVNFTDTACGSNCYSTTSNVTRKVICKIYKLIHSLIL